MAREKDEIVNTSGPGNMMPRSPDVKPDETTRLVDSFIRDKWVAPEDRDHEIAYLMQCRAHRAEKALAEIHEAKSRRRYASLWPFRILHHLET